MKLLLGCDAAVATWAARRIKYMESGADFGLCTCVGVTDSLEDMIGAVVFHNYMPRMRGVEVSFASTDRRWLTRAIVNLVFNHCFETLDCVRVSGRTPSRNKKSIIMIRRLGMKKEGCVRKGFGTDDMIISGMLKSEWAASPWNLANECSDGRLRAVKRIGMKREMARA